jgi:hypothetical protein
MDPNATLMAIRELIKQIEAYDNHMGSVAHISEQAELGLDLAEQITALDQWLSKGGFLPSAWHFARR